jgi:hypothetical protein
MNWLRVSQSELKVGYTSREQRHLNNGGGRNYDSTFASFVSLF